MNPVEKKQLWRWAVHNRTAGLERTLEEIRSTFTALLGDDRLLHDSTCLIERQMRVVELEVNSLRHLVSRYDYTPLSEYIPANTPATDENVREFLADMVKKFNRGDMPVIWKEYQRLLTIYTAASDWKKFYLACEAFMQ